MTRSSDSDPAMIADRVTSTFDLKMAELKELQRRAEDARKRAEETIAAKTEKAAKKQEQLLNQLLEAQVTEANHKNERGGLWNKLLAAACSLLVAIAGGGVYLGFQAQPEADAVETKQVKETVEKESREVEQRIHANERKVEKLKDIAIEQQVQIADDGAYTRDLIRAVHKRQAAEIDEVDVPDTVRDAKVKAEAIKSEKRRRGEKLFDADQGDPFAGIP